MPQARDTFPVITLELPPLMAAMVRLPSARERGARRGLRVVR